jgi:hypothetical protein
VRPWIGRVRERWGLLSGWGKFGLVATAPIVIPFALCVLALYVILTGAIAVIYVLVGWPR